MKILLIALITTSQTFAGFQWLYGEKIAAETVCRQRFISPVQRTSACLLGVTAYGDARGWQGIETTRSQAQTACQTLCAGAGELTVYCRNGCQFGRDADK